MRKEQPCDIYTEGYFKGYDDALNEVRDEMQSLAKGNPDYVNGVMNCIDILNKHIGGKA